MLSSNARILTVLALAGTAAFRASAQPPSSGSAGPRVEPGLETAVKWIWRVEPSPAGSWGLELPPHSAPTPTMTFPPMSRGGGSMPATVPRATSVAPASVANAYTVKRGDSLFVIGRRFKVPVPLLKEVNGLATDNIRVGQVLRIPSPEEVRARAPAPVPAPAAVSRKPAAPASKSPEQAELENLALQVFLDREGFSAGPIDGRDSPDFQKIVQLYRDAHDPAKDPAALRQMAQAAGDPLTRYTLKIEDFRFIAPPRAARAEAGLTPAPTPAKKKSKSAAPPAQQQAKPTYQELTSATMLAYRTPWEFVAERFHCDESYLRHLNAQLRDVPAIGTELQVPNVIPFAIERALGEPLQPPVDPSVTAAVVDLSRLEIYRNKTLVAVMPLSMARPGLRGRDSWVIRNAIPRPRLVTQQELRVKPQAAPRIFGRDDPNATPVPARTPIPVAQSLAVGPNNPVGILWINLTKSGSAEPLPYGLHGTSIPDHMRTQESLGGLRLTNWDIARAAHLLPDGTPLEWKQSGPPAPAPVVRPPM